MASGILWSFRITNLREDEPPIEYQIGFGAATGEPPDVTIGLIRGLETVRTAYADLPGLDGPRARWTSVPYSGPDQIANDASRLILSNHLHIHGLDRHLLNGAGHSGLRNGAETTLADYVKDTEFVHGCQILERVGLPPEALFVHHWPDLAVASAKYVEQRWPSTKAKKVTRLAIYQANGHQLDRPAALAVLRLARAYAGLKLSQDHDVTARRLLYATWVRGDFSHPTTIADYNLVPFFGGDQVELIRKGGDPWRTL